MKQKITQEQIEEMKKLKAEGKGIYQIAKTMKLTYVAVAYYVGDYKQKLANHLKTKRMLGYAREIAMKEYKSADIIALEGTPTDLGNGYERWEFKVFIGEAEPREEKYINIIKKIGRTKKSELKHEIVNKE